MLGYVHAGIGDANNIFHGKPVYGKASHAKAAGNVLFLKHGISRYPQAQALGQYLRLFDSGFRHQDNEFVPAVATHYIRLPALLLKEPANASQHQIAFQMPLRVIDLFKLIQVHQHDRKWTARAGCPLPLGVQGLPEEAAGLYASQPIGNRLLLQLLKHESVMQRRGEQVGQSLHYQDVLRRERVFTLALDIQYALQFLAVSDRDAQDSMRIRQDALQTLVTSHLHQSRLSSSRHSTDDAGPKRNPFGTGIVGRVARTGETALVQMTGDQRLQGVLPDSHAVLCIPITYGEKLQGVLNVERQSEDAFTPQDVLVMKTLADLLATALHNALVFQQLQQQSITDGLTGIKTRRFFWEALNSEWKRASRSGRPFSVVLMDLDKFKEVNDTKGHLEGDLVLARVGRLLEQKCRQSNVVARYGGDEFIILMPETGVEQAQILAERLRLWLSTDPMLAEHHITGSFGVGSFPVHGLSAESIIRLADAGMYISKKAGGDRVSTSDNSAQDEAGAVHRQLVSGYIEGFLQRERTGPEHLEELVGTLRKLVPGTVEQEAPLLKDSIEALTPAAESRELNCSGHGEMVAHYCETIARSLRLTSEDVADLVYAARVHDVGKIFVPERTLNKSGPLTDDEFYILKMHSRV